MRSTDPVVRSQEPLLEIADRSISTGNDTPRCLPQVALLGSNGLVARRTEEDEAAEAIGVEGAPGSNAASGKVEHHSTAEVGDDLHADSAGSLRAALDATRT